MRHESLTLSDGRTLGYSETGDPMAPPIFYCHGFPTCRMELEIIEPVLAANEVEARIIALDRPGYGNSSPLPNRTILDWAADVAQAADLLRIREFAVLGVSGGAPFAMACAVRLPSRVSRLGITVGVGPPGARGIEDSLIFRTAPRFAFMARFQFAMFAKGFERGQDERIFDQTIDNLGRVDRPVLDEPDTKDWFLRTMREAFKQGGKAAALEAGLYLRDWGFAPSSIEAETRLWYGNRDETVPAAVGEWLAGQIPGSILEVWPEHGHFTWMRSDEAASAVALTGAT